MQGELGLLPPSGRSLCSNWHARVAEWAQASVGSWDGTMGEADVHASLFVGQSVRDNLCPVVFQVRR